MITSLLGTKQGMTHVFLKSGMRQVASQIKIDPNVVIGTREDDKDGYAAVVLGTGNVKRNSKPVQGQLKKAEVSSTPRWVREVKTDEAIAVGQAVSVKDAFKPGDLVTVQGVTKGKGFAGGMKRWGFSGGPKTHGQSDRHRAPGSVGAGTTPGRVLKGKKMAGRMGGTTVSVANLVVLQVEENRLVVGGSIPGSRGTFLRITKIGEKKNFVGLVEKTKEDASVEQNQES